MGNEIEKEKTNATDQATQKTETEETQPNVEDEKKGLSKKQWILIFVVCLAVVAVAVTILLVNQYNERMAALEYEKMQQEMVQATPEPTASPNKTPTPKPEIPEEVKKGLCEPDKTVDFQALTELNEDVIGWVTVPGTQIDYPVMAGLNNTYYLDHNVENGESASGTPFLDMGNTTDFTDPLSVVYGHNMKNGTMFASLHEFEDNTFFDEYREIKLYTEEGMRVYEIFAAYPTDNKNVLYGKDYSQFEVFERYIDNVTANRDLGAQIRQIDVKPQDQVLVLSTCIRGENEQRYVIQGKLLKDEEAYLE